MALERLDKIEDFRGNPNQPGEMIITNLRLIWRLTNNKDINLSVGYDCIIQIQIK